MPNEIVDKSCDEKYLENLTKKQQRKKRREKKKKKKNIAEKGKKTCQIQINENKPFESNNNHKIQNARKMNRSKAKQNQMDNKLTWFNVSSTYKEHIQKDKSKDKKKWKGKGKKKKKKNKKPSNTKREKMQKKKERERRRELRKTKNL